MEPLYRFSEVVLGPPLRHGIRWHVEGEERIPRAGPVLLASNHISYMDPLCLAYVVNQAGRRVRFVAKAELFEHKLLARALRSLGQIPVARGTGDASGALDASAAALAAGECVALFPEGTISRDFDPMAGRTGTARLARITGIPVTPVGLWGGHRLLTTGRKRHLRLGVAVSIVVGEPVPVAATDNPRETTDRIMAAICTQVARARSIYPQSPTSAADEWWARPPESARLRSCRGRVAQELIDQQADAPSGDG